MDPRNKFSYTYNLPNQESPPKLNSERDGEEAGNQDQVHHHRHFDLHQDGIRPRRDPAPPVADSNPGQVPLSRSNSNSNRQEQSPSATTATVHYRECQRNHAAHLGTHVVDGCGEFMPGGEEGTSEYFKCAACGCHRNFHRQDCGTRDAQPPPPPPPPPPPNCFVSYNPGKPISQKHVSLVSASAPPQPLRVTSSPHPPTMMAFGGAAAESSSEDLNMFRSHVEGQPSEMYGSSRKRFRTKFSQDQKEKMMQFAEKIEWRIQKRDEEEVKQFCDEVGVKRQVFKVWMHNNKQSMKRKNPLT